MCNRTALLAQYNSFRRISICEHGVVHLTWDQMTLFLLPSEFQKLAMVLDQAVIGKATGQDLTHTQEQPYRVAEQQESVQLWIGQYAIMLQPVDYLLFGSLVSKGVERLPSTLNKKETGVQIRLIDANKRRADMHVPSIQFSVN